MMTSKEYQSRRDRVLKNLGTSVGVIFAGERGNHGIGAWRPDLDFLYLTGIENEPGAAVVFNPGSEDPKARITLLLRPIDPEADQWDGLRETISKKMKEELGFDSIRRMSQLPMLLTQAIRRSKKCACLHGFSNAAGKVSPDLAIFRQIAERVVGVAIEDRTQILPSMRAVKSKSELALMRKAASATKAGYDAAFAAIRPGVLESDVQLTMERAFVDAGADRSSPGGVAYGSIVGSGVNAAVLHYRDNASVLKAGELLLIDAGAQVGGYACDVTRTIPVSGRFTSEQADLYELVLKAQSAAIRTVRAGIHMYQVNDAAREVFDKVGHIDRYIHSIGHQLGLSVHDSTPDGPLKAGNVVTIEPGLYMVDRKLGIRIEDGILVTSRPGGENLTAAIPKSIKDIERCMRR